MSYHPLWFWLHFLRAAHLVSHSTTDFFDIFESGILIPKLFFSIRQICFEYLAHTNTNGPVFDRFVSLDGLFRLKGVKSFLFVRVKKCFTYIMLLVAFDFLAPLYNVILEFTVILHGFDTFLKSLFHFLSVHVDALRFIELHSVVSLKMVFAILSFLFCWP